MSNVCEIPCSPLYIIHQGRKVHDLKSPNLSLDKVYENRLRYNLSLLDDGCFLFFDVFLVRQMYLLFINQFIISINGKFQMKMYDYYQYHRRLDD
jgi:hypothetical protein